MVVEPTVRLGAMIKSVVYATTGILIEKFLMLGQYATIVNICIVFQTRKSEVFRIRESVVLYCMYLCLHTKMSVVLNMNCTCVFY